MVFCFIPTHPSLASPLLTCNDTSIASICLLHYHRICCSHQSPPSLWGEEMAEHTRILGNELHCTCAYNHPCSRSNSDAPPLPQPLRSVVSQYWLDGGHKKRCLSFRARRIRWSSSSSSAEGTAHSCQNRRHSTRRYSVRSRDSVKFYLDWRYLYQD